MDGGRAVMSWDMTQRSLFCGDSNKQIRAYRLITLLVDQFKKSYLSKRTKGQMRV
ncbi:hypothetical Protein YC6258_02213 [Gynuella sunshinyii YC6258]|uniref:Uncharacterized protein n=1 Tax=Gynuella sunshinyii YC6258 TaxID=1445510 RepID=A0A0C5VHZ7_9GAMM|nr:hypothetical Protein YC6258_02213 [Gynuella sunshinyii YC6258]